MEEYMTTKELAKAAGVSNLINEEVGYCTKKNEKVSSMENMCLFYEKNTIYFRLTFFCKDILSTVGG